MACPRSDDYHDSRFFKIKIVQPTALLSIADVRQAVLAVFHGKYGRLYNFCIYSADDGWFT